MHSRREFPVSFFRVKLIRTFLSSFLSLPHLAGTRACSTFSRDACWAGLLGGLFAEAPGYRVGMYQLDRTGSTRLHGTGFRQVDGIGWILLDRLVSE